MSEGARRPTGGRVVEAAGFSRIDRTPHEITTRAGASAVTDPALFPVMGVPPDREEEASDLVRRHLDQFAVGSDDYEFPLAFVVYDASV